MARKRQGQGSAPSHVDPWLCWDPVMMQLEGRTDALCTPYHEQAGGTMRSSQLDN